MKSRKKKKRKQRKKKERKRRIKKKSNKGSVFVVNASDGEWKRTSAGLLTKQLIQRKKKVYIYVLRIKLFEVCVCFSYSAFHWVYSDSQNSEEKTREE